LKYRSGVTMSEAARAQKRQTSARSGAEQPDHVEEFHREITGKNCKHLRRQLGLT
jgi:hypothetical protein